MRSRPDRPEPVDDLDMAPGHRDGRGTLLTASVSKGGASGRSTA